MLEGYIFITMNYFNKSKSIFLTGLFFICMPAFSFNSDAKICSDIENPSVRLSCYDDLFKESKPIDEADLIPKKSAITKIDDQEKKDFGLEKPNHEFSITSKIVNVNKRGNYKIYITLENDQIWRSVKDIYDRALVSKGQTVIISQGFMSGYVMKVEGKKTSLRVRRVK